MPRLIFRSTAYNENAHDINKIVTACREQGYEISANDAQAAWQAYSRSMAASWMFVPDEPEQVLFNIRSHCDEYED